MALLDFIVDANFRSEAVGRVVVFPGDRRHRGYVVKSQAEELKIRSFLRMFYYAHASILLLGGLLASGWSTDLRHVLDRRSTHVLGTEGIFLGVYLLVVGIPYFLVWRSYKKAFLSFVSVEDEVLVSGRSAGRQQILIVAGLIVLGAVALGILLLFLVGRKP
jgi:hypothetical protein